MIEILVCNDTGCSSSASLEIINELKKVIENKKLEDVNVIKTGCFGLCSKGPFVILSPSNICYSGVKVSDCTDIIDGVKNNQVVKRLLTKDYDNLIKEKLSEQNFYKKQKRVVLNLCGKINPENVEDYIKNSGYEAFKKCLYNNDKESIINVLKDSKLKGRGGAGFLTGLKWETAFKESSLEKYIVCNADEGDPGAFMDRSILEGNPHSVIEGMLIAGNVVGASKGYIYVRREYPKAVERLKLAIKDAYDKGFLGENVLESNFSFDLEIRLGAGAFVCGEETALLESIEGRRGHPRNKPPFPAICGLFGKPTIINNVETLANIAQIVLNGSEWFNELGSEKSGGTKVFALGGNVVNNGLVEVPIGTTLRDIIYSIGGGIPNNKKFKAAQTGGPSGGIIPDKLIDVKMDYDELKEIGTMMGSGGLIVMDETKCMVALAKFYIDFSVDESCGKCTPCRIGLKRMQEILDKIIKFEATMEDLEKLKELANLIKNTSLCGLGQSAPNPVLSTLMYFEDEYVSHINDKICLARECMSNLKIEIIKDDCKGCGICQKKCPKSAIVGDGREVRVIDQSKCIKCKVCVNTCPFSAIKEV